MDILLVPIQLDALFVASETMVTEAFANFSRLPYCNNRIDYNPDTANISESILSKPFQNQNLPLRKGMHLHWTLPEALSRGGANGTPNSYPVVPNRWLVTKNIKGAISKQWIVESDYLHAEPEDHDSIAFPEFNPGKDSPQPFNYLGRQLAFNSWKEDTTAKRMPRLTAMGYGEPAFAAFYPNCYSVFGCYDPDITAATLKDLTYQVIGWYSDPAQDPFHILKESDEFKKYIFTNINKAGTATTDTDIFQNFFKQKLGWLIPVTHNDIAQLPERIYCFAQLDFEPEVNYTNKRRQNDVKLGIGNTGTEAISAFLANVIATSKEDKLQTEEQLESLLAYSNLSSKELDLGTRFQEARHEKGFKAEKGGQIWEIRPSHGKNDNSAQNDKQEITINLPNKLAELLNKLNERQEKSDELAALLRYRKHILFADWYKYMLCAYPPDDGRSDYPDIDLVKNFIERTLLIEPPNVVAPAILPELEERLRQFNNSDVPAWLSVKLHKKENTVTPAALTIDNIERRWIENLPFSHCCLQFNNDSKDLPPVSISLQNSKGVQAISLWINLAAQQTSGATLLATKNRGPQIGKSTFDAGLNKVAINGEILPASLQKQWHLLPKDQWFHLHVEWEECLGNDDTIYLFANNNTALLQGKLASLRLFEKTVAVDELLCDMNILGHHQYTLKATAGPRYWQPTEPVIVLEGETVKPTNRHGAASFLNEGSLACQVAKVANYPLQQSDLTTLLEEISKGKPAPGQEKQGFNTWTTQPWTPFLLEWQVEVHPMEEAGNLTTGNRHFEPGFITSNYNLPANSPELSITAGKKTMAAATLYTGRSILTPHAKTRLLKDITAYFTHLKQEDCYQALIPPTTKEKLNYNEELTKWYNQKPQIPKEGSPPDVETVFKNYKNWYLDKPVYNNSIQKFKEVFVDESKRIKDFNYTLIQAALQLVTRHFLSQALSGFNNALLMHHQTLQLPVADPLGFPEYKAFTERVKNAIAGNNNLAPLPHNDFLPIRTGKMRIHKLRIIDSFGQGKDISVDQIIKAESLSNQACPDFAWLPPRFVPPARINFRWLSALSNDQTMSTLAQDNPICGWLLANHLDNSVMVYGCEGHALGLIDQQATWRTAPGSPLNYHVDDITNPHLRKIVQRLAVSSETNEADKNSKITYLQYFISATDTALEHIHPEADINHQETALLMGKPMAVVRASIGLQLKEGPPIHHGWNDFLQDLERNARNTNNFEKVQVPVRLGDRSQLNDGLVGYWIEDEQYTLGATFYSTGSNNPEKQLTGIQYTDQPENPDLQLTLEKASQKTLTLLVYPPGEVHATTGMLPVKEIHIPKDQYTPALKSIHITFLTAPVLTSKDQLALPLPKEMGYEWSWLAKERFTWVEVAENGIVRKDNAIQTFTNGADLWQHLLQKGWIIEIDDNRASIVPSNQRSNPALDEPFSQQADTIQHWLDAGHIVPANTRATFSGKQYIKEGWLKLKPSS